jgi:antitoxin component of MazEF toxin-antitoxin module
MENVMSIPKAILKALNLHVSVDCKIVLTPVLEKITLEDLLAGSPQEKLQSTHEDREWIDEAAVGREE